jgi:hypothetical protein
MTMGFRNRPSSSSRTYDGSPTVGRIVNGVMGAGAIAAMFWNPVFVILLPFALAALYIAIFKKDWLL